MIKQGYLDVVAKLESSRITDNEDCQYVKYKIGLPAGHMTLEKILETLLTFRKNEQRYSYVRWLMECRGLVPERLLYSGRARSKPVHETAWVEGAQFLAAREPIEAFHLYTCCLIESTPGSKDRARALKGRSNALYHMRRYEECANDVRRALADPWGLPDGLEFDLLYRGSQAAKRLGRGQEMAEFVSLGLQVLDVLVADGSVSTEAAGRIRETLGRASKRCARPANGGEPQIAPLLVRARNEPNPDFSEHLVFKQTQDMGLGVFTTRDLEPGDVIAMEDPYLGGPLHDVYYVCHYADCQKFNMAVIFCQGCTSVYYCSEDCLDKDYHDGVHNLECKLLRTVKKLPGNKKINQLVLKWFLRESTKMGIKEYCSTVFMLNKCKVDTLNKKSIKNKLYDDFMAAYTMEIDDYRKTVKMVLYFNCIAVEMIQILLLAGYIIPYSLTSTVGASLVHMLHILHSNSENFIMNNDFSQILNYDGVIVSDFTFSLYPSISRINNSCDPNVILRYLPDKRTLVLSASRPISKNNQLFISYGPTFMNNKLEERQLYYEQRFNFKCCCQPCKENWPELEYYPHFIDQKQIINPSTTLQTVMRECRKYESLRYSLIEGENFKEQIAVRKRFFFDFMKFIHANVKRPFYLFEDCHNIILKDNNACFIDKECFQLMNLMASINILHE